MSDPTTGTGCGCANPVAAAPGATRTGGDDGTRLAATQARVVELVEYAARLPAAAGSGVGTTPTVADVQAQIVTLVERATRLQAAANHLAVTPPVEDGCGDGCPCVAASAASATGAVRIPLSRTVLAGASAGGPDLACTLQGGADAMHARITDWQTVIGRATARKPVDGGVALSFDHDAALTVELARLAAAEYACCSFFGFSLTVNADGVRLAVHAPDDARDLVTAMFGVPA